MSTNNDLMSVKELAAKLKVTDALLKKLIKDFDIETTRVLKRIHLQDSSVKTIREILALRASGKKNKEIKELFDAAQADLVKTKTEAPQLETKDEPETESKILKTRNKIKNKIKNKIIENPINDQPEQRIDTKVETKSKDETEDLDITSYLDETEDDEISMAMRLAEDDGNVNDNPRVELKEENLDLDDDDHDDEVAEVREEVEQRLSPKKARRRQFSFRYIQRQIANDAKRIQYLQQKLKRGRLSKKEQLDLEDSLEQRSKLHSGWVHLLRWVKS